MLNSRTDKPNVAIPCAISNDNFIEDFFDSDLFQEIIARNDKKGIYVVRTTSNSVYILDRNSNSCIELHFPEEILLAIKECS